jgi:hypothetical protein
MSSAVSAFSSSLRAIVQAQRATFPDARALLRQHRAVRHLLNGQP